MRLLGDILQIAIYTSIQMPSEKALFIILLFVIYEVKNKTKQKGMINYFSFQGYRSNEPGNY